MIIGGGVTGLACAYELKDVAEVTIIERNKLGGDSNKGENKYIQMTPLVKSFFNTLGVPFSDYVIQNGVLLKGEIERLDLVIKKMKKHEKERLSADHYRKTRLLEPPKKMKLSMDEPSFSKPMKAVRVGNDLLLEFLVENIQKVKKVFSNIERIGCKSVLLKNGDIVYFDFLIFTIPLWEIKKYAWWDIPYCNAVVRNVIKVSSIVNEYLNWDFVYTPYTPGDSVWRLSPFEGHYLVEVNGCLRNWIEQIYSDLYFLFGKGWHFVETYSLKGHMLEADVDGINWPMNVSPLGMYAEWDPQMTFDVILERIEKLRKRWKL